MPVLPVRVAIPQVLQSPVSGSALVGAKFTFTMHEVGKALGSGAAAEIFLTETEASKVAGNTIVTDNTGRLTQGEGAVPAWAQYWIPEGRYDILIAGAGLKSVYITRELTAAYATMVSASERSPLSIVKHAGAYEAASGELGVQETNGAPTTLPSAATKDQIIAVFCASGATSCKVTTSGGAFIYGKWLTLASKTATVTLTEGMCAVFQSNGTNWLLLPGSEIKSEQKYSATTALSQAEWEAGITPSTSRNAIVKLRVEVPEGTNAGWQFFVGGVELPNEEVTTAASGRARIGNTLWVPAGQSWKLTAVNVSGLKVSTILQ